MHISSKLRSLAHCMDSEIHNPQIPKLDKQYGIENPDWVRLATLYRYLQFKYWHLLT